MACASPCLLRFHHGGSSYSSSSTVHSQHPQRSALGSDTRKLQAVLACLAVSSLPLHPRRQMTRRKQKQILVAGGRGSAAPLATQGCQDEEDVDFEAAISKQALKKYMQRAPRGSQNFLAALGALRRGDVLTTMEEYLQAIKLLCRRKMVKEAKSVVDYMWYFSDALTPDERAYNIVLASLEKGERIEDAAQLFEDMIEYGVAMTAKSYKTMIGAYAKKGKSSDAKQLLQEMLASGVEADAESFSLAIYACRRGDDSHDDAMRILDDMRSRGISMTSQTYDALIWVHAGGGDLEQAMQAFKQMLDAGLSPTSYTFSALLSACEQACNWKAALKTIQVMRETGIEATSGHYHSVLKALVAGHQHALAVETFEHMFDTGVVPLRKTFTLLADCHKHLGRPDMVRNLLKKMLGMRLKPDKAFLEVALGAAGQSWKEALEVLELMDQNGYRTSRNRWNAVFENALEQAVASGDAEKASELLAAMKKRRLHVSRTVHTAAMDALGRNNSEPEIGAVGASGKQLQANIIQGAAGENPRDDLAALTETPT